MLPVVADQRALRYPEMAGNNHIIGDNADVIGIETCADQLTGQFTGNGVTIAVRADKTG